MTRFSISLVIYQPDIPLLLNTLKTLSAAVDFLSETNPCQVNLVVFDNTVIYREYIDISKLIKSVWPGEFSLIHSSKNVGFGAGHNQAIAVCNSDYHLILNPDVLIDKEAIFLALSYLENNIDSLLVSPFAIWEDGKRQYLCKRYPTIFDLVLRGFAPEKITKMFEKRLANYELKGITEQEVVYSVPIASGCCMWVRTSALKQIGGFCENFFLYFEDFDLCLRLGQYGKLAYLPEAKIVHAGGNASKKGLRHIILFMQSAKLFFQKHGWRYF